MSYQKPEATLSSIRQRIGAHRHQLDALVPGKNKATVSECLWADIAESLHVIANHIDANVNASAEVIADVSVLGGTVSAIETALASGAHDADLGALLAAELDKSSRKGVIDAIASRAKDL